MSFIKDPSDWGGELVKVLKWIMSSLVKVRGKIMSYISYAMVAIYGKRTIKEVSI